MSAEYYMRNKDMHKELDVLFVGAILTRLQAPI